MKVKIGDAIKIKRIEIGYSQSQLAKKISIDRSSISRWENNLSTPSVEKLYKLCKIFKIDINDFLSMTTITKNKYNPIYMAIKKGIYRIKNNFIK